MIVKIGDSLGETFGNFVGRLAATLAVLTPVIPAFRASVLVVHPILPDCDHAAMLTMVKDGSWFRLAHRHSPSMAFYRARASADTLKRDELRAAAGQCSEQGEMEKASGGAMVDVAAAFEWVCGRSRNSMPTSRSFCRKQWREQPDTIYLDPPRSAMIKQPGSREGGTVASGRLGTSTNHVSRQPAADEGRGACPIWTLERGSSWPIAFAAWGRKIGP